MLDNVITIGYYYLMSEILIQLPPDLVRRIKLGRDTCWVTLYKGGLVACTDMEQKTGWGCRARVNGCPLRDTVPSYPASIDQLAEYDGITIVRP